MVKKIEDRGRTLFICEECGLAYEQREWAEKCQKWCKENQSCNLEIIQHAVPQESN